MRGKDHEEKGKHISVHKNCLTKFVTFARNTVLHKLYLFTTFLAFRLSLMKTWIGLRRRWKGRRERNING